VITSSTVAFWSLNDGSGATVVDATGRGNNLTPNTVPAVDAAAYFALGRNANDGTQGFTGAMRSWGGAGTLVTSAERDTLYNSGSSALSWSSLAGTLQAKFRWWYDLAGTGVTVTTDQTGRGNTLTVAGNSPTSVSGPGGVGNATHWNGSGQAYASSNTDLGFGNRYTYICGWVNVGSPTATTVQAMLSKWQGLASGTCPECVCYIHASGGNGQFWGDMGKGGDTEGPNHIANNAVVTHGTNLSGSTWYFVEWEYNAPDAALTGVPGQKWSLTVNRGTPVVVYPVAQPAAQSPLVATAVFPAVGAAGFTSGSTGLASGGTQAGGVYDEAGYHYAAKTSPGADLKFGNNAKTVWFWIKLASRTTSQVPLGIYDPSGAVADWLIFYNTGNRHLSLQLSDGGGSNFAVADVLLDDASAHLVVAWYDKTGDNKLHIDLDHSALTNASAVLSFTPATTTKDFRMGSAIGGNQFEGTLDGVGIANGVPTQADLDYLWNSGNGREWPFAVSRFSLLGVGG
jgi:hypothetical protein